MSFLDLNGLKYFYNKYIKKLFNSIGDLTTLKTTEKTNIVGAVNELNEDLIIDRSSYIMQPNNGTPSSAEQILKYKGADIQSGPESNAVYKIIARTVGTGGGGYCEYVIYRSAGEIYVSGSDNPNCPGIRVASDGYVKMYMRGTTTQPYSVSVAVICIRTG